MLASKEKSLLVTVTSSSVCLSPGILALLKTTCAEPVALPDLSTLTEPVPSSGGRLSARSRLASVSLKEGMDGTFFRYLSGNESLLPGTAFFRRSLTGSTTVVPASCTEKSSAAASGAPPAAGGPPGGAAGAGAGAPACRWTTGAVEEESAGNISPRMTASLAASACRSRGSEG